MLKKWIEQNKTATRIICIGVLLLSAITLGFWSRPVKPPEPVAVAVQVYYYNPASGELFGAPVQSIPPIALPEGAAGAPGGKGYRAYVYSCGECNVPTARTIAYIETFSDEAREYLKKELQDPEARMPRIMERVHEMPGGHMISKPLPVPVWKSPDDEESMELIAAFRGNCEDGKPVDDCKPAQ